jgi:hypothetical protein
MLLTSGCVWGSGYLPFALVLRDAGGKHPGSI